MSQLNCNPMEKTFVIYSNAHIFMTVSYFFKKNNTLPVILEILIYLFMASLGLWCCVAFLSL